MGAATITPWDFEFSLAMDVALLTIMQREGHFNGVTCCGTQLVAQEKDTYMDKEVMDNWRLAAVLK